MDGNSFEVYRGRSREHFWQECARLRPLLVKAAARYGLPAEAEDVVHNAFLRASRYPGLDLGRLNVFLTAVIRRLCVDDHRRRVAEQRIASHGMLRPVPGADPADSVSDRAEAVSLSAALGCLTTRERFVLRHLAQGRPHEEIAALLGTTRRATECLASRARSRVRKRLAAAGGRGMA